MVKRPKKSSLFTGQKYSHKSKGKNTSGKIVKESGLIRELSKDHKANVKARAETKKATAKYKYASRAAGYTGISGVGVSNNLQQDDKMVQEKINKPSGGDPTPQITTVTPGPDGTNPIMADDEPEYYYYD